MNALAHKGLRLLASLVLALSLCPVAFFTQVGQAFADSVTEVQIGTGTSSTHELPYDNYYRYATSQMLYKGSEINASGAITSISFQVASAAQYTPTTLKIYMGVTESDTLTASTALSASQMTLVYSGSPTLGKAAGWETLVLDTPFGIGAGQNLVVAVCHAATQYTSNLKYCVSSASNACLVRYDDTDSSFGTLEGTGSYSEKATRPNVKLGLTSTIAVPTPRKDLVYNGTEQTPFSLSGPYTVTGASKKTSAGTYTAYVAPAQGCTWEDGTTSTKTIKWTIAKKPVGVPSITTNFVYDGSKKSPVAVGEGYSCTGRLATDAGTYTCTVKLLSNYCWIDGTTGSISFEWTITESTEEVITLGNGLQGDEFPFSTFFGNSTCQMLYKASEIGRSGQISSVAFQVSPYNEGLSTSVVDVYMGTTSQTTLTASTALGASQLTKVFSGTHKMGLVAGWESIALDDAYYYDSSKGNLVVVVCERSASDSNVEYYCTPVPGAMIYRSSSRNSAYAEIPGSGSYLDNVDTRPNARFTMHIPNVAEGDNIPLSSPIAATGLVYDGTEKTGVAAAVGYELTGTPKAVDAGSYTATANLRPGYCWSDGSLTNKNIAWTIGKASQAAPQLVSTSLELMAGASTQFEVPEGPSGVVEAEVTDGTASVMVSGSTLSITAGQESSTIRIRYGESTNYHASGYVEVQVSTAAPIQIPTAAAGLVYDGTQQEGVAAGAGYTLSGTFAATNAGSYTATATLTQGHTWSDGTTAAKSIPWSIAKASQAAPVLNDTSLKVTSGESVDVTIPAGTAGTVEAQVTEGTATVQTYGNVVRIGGSSMGSSTISVRYAGDGNYLPSGYAQISVTVVIPTDAPAAITGLVYTGSELTGVRGGTGYTLSGTVRATEAGIYYATAALRSGYVWSDGTTDAKRVSWSIAKAGQTAPSLDVTSYRLKSGESASFTVGAGFGALEGDVSGGDATLSISGSKVTITAVSAGNSTVRLRYAGDDNHNASSYSSISISSFIPVKAPVAATGLVFNGSTQTGVLPGLGYTLTGTTKAMGAGSYSATATLSEGYVWEDGTDAAKHLSWSISKVNQAAPAVESASVQLNVGESVDVTVTLGDTGVVEADVVEGAASVAVRLGKVTISGTEAGVSTVRVRCAGDSNHNPSPYSLINVEVKAVATPEPEPEPDPELISVAAPTAAAGLTYNGTQQVGVAAGTGYSLSGTSAATDAGIYTATATLSEGYAWADGTTEPVRIPWSISKGSQVAPALTSSSLRVIAGQTGTARVAYAAPGALEAEVTEGTAAVSVQGTQITVSGTSMGASTIRLRFAATSNYEASEYVTLRVEVIVSVQVPSAVTGLVFNGTQQVGVAAGTGYTLSGTAKGTYAGNYTTQATLLSGYVWSDGTVAPKHIPWSIAKAPQAAPKVASGNVSFTVGEQAVLNVSLTGSEELEGDVVNGTAQMNIVNGTVTITASEAGESAARLRFASGINYEPSNYIMLSIVASPAAAPDPGTDPDPGADPEPGSDPEPQPISVAAPTAAAGLVYNGSMLTGVSSGTGYALSGIYRARNAGSYSATATLAEGYVWSDGSTDEKSINWSIAKAPQSAPVFDSDSLELTVGTPVQVTAAQSAGALEGGVTAGSVSMQIEGYVATFEATEAGQSTARLRYKSTGNYEASPYATVTTTATQPNNDSGSGSGTGSDTDPANPGGSGTGSDTDPVDPGNGSGTGTGSGTGSGSDPVDPGNGGGTGGTVTDTPTTPAAPAQVNAGSGLKCVISGTGMTIASGALATGKLVIPEKVTYNGRAYAVTAIGASAFANNKAITSVTIPKTVTTVAAGAFKGCSKLVTVVFEGTPTVAAGAFDVTAPKLKKGKISSAKAVKSGSKRGTKIKVKKVAGVGYQFWRSTSKTKDSKGYKVTAKAMKKAKYVSSRTGLKKGKTYYVAYRTFKKVGAITFYGPWTSFKKVKTAK